MSNVLSATSDLNIANFDVASTLSRFISFYSSKIFSSIFRTRSFSLYSSFSSVTRFSIILLRLSFLCHILSSEVSRLCVNSYSSLSLRVIPFTNSSWEKYYGRWPSAAVAPIMPGTLKSSRISLSWRSILVLSYLELLFTCSYTRWVAHCFIRTVSSAIFYSIYTLTCSIILSSASPSSFRMTSWLPSKCFLNLVSDVIKFS